MATPLRVCLGALFIVALARPALSWGFQGHAVVCAIAQGLLTPKASERVKALLPDFAEGSLARVCPWPDVIGHTNPKWRWSLPLHYIDTPDGLCNFNFSRDCHLKCVAAAILNYTQQLTSLPVERVPSLSQPSALSATLTSRASTLRQRIASLSPAYSHSDSPWVNDILTEFRAATTAERYDEKWVREAGSTVLEYLTGSPKDEDYDPHVFNATVALMFLGHFVGDIHQPLHVGFTSDYGGNRIKVHWYKKKTNLHEVWDTEIIKEDMFKYHNSDTVAFAVWLAERLSGEWKGNIEGWVSCESGLVCPNKFASESISDACKWAYANVTTGDTLGDDYFNSRFPVVEMELAKAGVRLAATLMRLFDPAPQEAAFSRSQIL